MTNINRSHLLTKALPCCVVMAAAAVAAAASAVPSAAGPCPSAAVMLTCAHVRMTAECGRGLSCVSV